MKILLTNDDGINADGLAALAQLAAMLGQSICVAPWSHQSGCGHRVTTDGPIRLERRGEDRWAIDGTPADCVRVALARLAPDFDWVLSGVNHGGNLGADVHHSGTVAAVREAALHGKPGIAVSHYRKRGMDIDWARAQRWLRPILSAILAKPSEMGVYWNINLPSLAAHEPEPSVVHCPLELGPLPLSFREAEGGLHYDANYHQRARTDGSDVATCFAGHIAVTRLALGG
jgi:5'-nucleotidase